jgi:diaminopimelate epimerase
MTLHFDKYQGAGNDFVIVDDRLNFFLKDAENQQELISFLCDRRFGIGADGLMLLRNQKDYDFQMVYFNSDGRESTMCGNGGRCLVAYAYDRKLISSKVNFIAVDGPHQAEVFETGKDEYWISLQMKDVVDVRKINDGLFLDTGSPHFVHFCNDVNAIDVYDEGKKIRHQSEFGEGGTNVNFVQNTGNELIIRTFERGVENETLACGTGITASAIAAYYSGLIHHQEEIQIKARGGDLKVSFKASPDKKSFFDVYLQGPAKKVFEGEINL